MLLITLDNLADYSFKSVSEAWIAGGIFNDNWGFSTRITYVPTEVELLKRENKMLWKELARAENIIDWGEIPNALKGVA